MSNFAFLKPEWTDLFDAARRAETAVRNDARSSCFYARRALELAIEWLYQHDSSLKRPYDNNLSALLYEPSFKNALTGDLFLKVKTIKDVGNIAVHSRKAVTERDALRVTKELFHFLYWIARTYTRQTPANYQGLNFDEAKVPPQIVATVKQTVEQLKKMEEELRQKDKELAQSALALADTDAQIAQLKKEIAAAKKKNEAIPDDHDYSEAETRAYFIDLLLHEAGWSLDKTEDREYEVIGMPNANGIGYVDYVLWGNDGKPLAVVEAKRTTVDPRVGRQQAKLYADCLEQMTGQRPLIFYTNGYKTWFWDDQNYPPREVQGFYKRDELELLIQRRTMRKELTEAAVNETIVERYYQIEAITRTSEHFARQQRKALIVMATGAGKTRTVIALCELLQRCNWIKRVLFLADRVALVKQACNAFKKHLPDASPVNLVTERNATGSRVYVSTYPTMMGLINQMDGDTRRFGVGHFDLIVIDEAHRSIYQKYRAIFEYFDALLVGLTATPKDEVDRNTYSLFDLEKGAPTFAYELDQAVADGFLVPPRPLELDLKFIREGIKYDDLSEEEQEQWDAMDWDEDGNIPDAVESAALNKWFFNEDTVDKALATLMQHGQKVAGGDVLGKTIIFAKNHQHALFLQERFDQHYPHYKGAFARVIDNYETYAESLLDDFSNVDKRPQIAISVDMLDTGIDIPEAVNLMFFKMVRSKTKFFQMIGRGTRLRPDLFGPGEDKKDFYIFDCCRNFEFFNQNAQGIEGNSQDSLGTKLFKTRLELLESFRHMKSDDAEIKTLDQGLADTLCREVAAMNTNNFVVRPHRQQVEKYREPAAWEQLNADDFDEIAHILAGLPSELEAEDETAKRFDLTMLKLQLSLLNIDAAFTRLSTNVKEIASRLEEKQSIPMVREQLELILDLQQDEYWSDITLPMLEDVRKRLRDLVKFIEKKQRKILTSDFTDELGGLHEVGLSGITTAADREQYRKKVTHFLKAHENHITIHKLKRNLTITPSDIAEIERIFFASGELGTREDFERAYGKQEHLGLFIRKLVGLDREAAKEAFGDYLLQKTLSANQIRFIDQIIDYLTQNGVMEAKLLYETPFTDYSPAGLDGVFGDGDADRIVGILRNIRANAAAAA